MWLWAVSHSVAAKSQVLHLCMVLIGDSGKISVLKREREQERDRMRARRQVENVITLQRWYVVRESFCDIDAWHEPENV